MAEPVSDTAGDAVATETTVATPTDQDADNLADALEPEAGLDPTAADTDGDYVADGDEFALYQTDPTIADTDGDGALDGEELFGTHTNPLLWEESSDPAASSATTTDPAPEAAPVAETTTPAETTAPVAADTASGDAVVPPPAGTTENLSATSGGASSLGDGDASAVPGTVTRDGVTLSGAPLLGPDGTYRVSESSPPVINVSGETTGISVVPAPGLETAPAPVAEPVASTETAAPVEGAEPVAAETAVATPADQDADNMADASEAEIGLDPSDPDTDGDGVADGDEGTLYGTDPFAGDSDGDGLMDGDELYVAGTDPLTGDAAGTA